MNYHDFLDSASLPEVEDSIVHRQEERWQVAGHHIEFRYTEVSFLRETSRN